jgi:hypothetical protein
MMRVQFAVAALGLVAFSPAVALAQSQTLQHTAFVHGLGHTSATWQQTADRLRQDYAIEAHRPFLSSYELFATQSQQLRSFLSGLPDNTIAIGESNGGLVSRLANAEGRPFGGVVTVVTPHAGARLAQSVVNGHVFNFGQNVAMDIAAPFWYYGYYWDWVAWIAYPFASAMYGVAWYLGELAADVGYWGPGSVLPQMYPGSAFLSGLNSSENLSREAGAIGRRIGITSVTDPRFGNYGIAWRGLAPNHWAEITWVQYTVIDLFLFGFEYYANYWDYGDPDAWDKRAGAFLWLVAAGAVAAIDPFWCFFIGATSQSSACEPSDGIVPLSSQAYPTALRFDVVGPAHLQVAGDALVRDRLAQTLRDQFGVPRRITSLTVSPTTLTLAPGSGGQLLGVLRNSDGNPVMGTINWSSSNASVASVDGTGYVTGLANGTASITASGAGFAQSATVTVQSVPNLTSVYISGPSSMPYGVLGRWTAYPTGGLEPLQYSWRVNGVQVQNSTMATLSRRVMADMQLQVVVTDARGQSRTDYTWVTVESESGCGGKVLCED